MPSVQSVTRVKPLAPCAALGLGPAALALVERLLQLAPEQLERLRGVASPDAVVVLGLGDDLPWSEGIVYLGQEPEAPELLLPCVVAPSVPAPLLFGALKLRFAGELRAPCAVWLEPPLVISLAEAQTLNTARLTEWRSERVQP